MQVPWAHCRNMKWMYRALNFLSWGVFMLFYRVKVYGQEHISPGAAVIAANHVSFLDPPVIGITCPQEVHFLARQSLFRIPLLRWFMRHTNTHPLKGDGGDTAVFKTVCKLLQEGHKVVLFPEGKRSYDNTLAPIKPGISLFVAKTHAAVIPTYVFGTFAAWPRARALPKIWKTIGCVFGSPILWEQFEHLEKKEAQEVFAKTLTEAILRLKTWYEQGAYGTPP